MSAFFGTVIRAMPSSGVVPGGIFRDGKYLWQIDSATDLLYQTDVRTGAVIRAIAPPAGFTQLSGVARNGKYLIVCSVADAKVAILDMDGVLISSFSTVYRDMDDRGYKLVGIINQLNYIASDGTIIRSQNPSGAQGSATIFKGNRVVFISTGVLLREHYTNAIETPAVGIREVNFGVDPQGITNDGRCLYISENDTDLIYQVIH